MALMAGAGSTSRQDGEQFEECLRRCHALEQKLTQQVQVDISQLRQKWVQLRVDRVTNNTFKLYQVREQLKLSKEEQILEEFTKVKQCLATSNMDDDTFEAARDTCLVLGGKLGAIRRRQDRCYGDTRDLELVVDKEIVALGRYEERDLGSLDLEEVRGRTPVRQLSPTPLDRHRSRSREPSEFRLPGAKLSQVVSSRRSTTPDPHAYFSRPGSSVSVYGGRGGEAETQDTFRAAMEARQQQEEEDGLVLRSHTGQLLATAEAEVFGERPVSAMSEVSLEGGGAASRPGSRAEMAGDEVSRDNTNNNSDKPAPAAASPGQAESSCKSINESVTKASPENCPVTTRAAPATPAIPAAPVAPAETRVSRSVTITARESKAEDSQKSGTTVSKSSVSPTSTGSTAIKQQNIEDQDPLLAVKGSSEGAPVTKHTVKDKAIVGPREVSKGDTEKQQNSATTVSLNKKCTLNEEKGKIEIKDNVDRDNIAVNGRKANIKNTENKSTSISQKVEKPKNCVAEANAKKDETEKLHDNNVDKVKSKKPKSIQDNRKSKTLTKPETLRQSKDGNAPKTEETPQKSSSPLTSQSLKSSQKRENDPISVIKTNATNTCLKDTSEDAGDVNLSIDAVKALHEVDQSAELISEAKEIFASIARESSKNQEKCDFGDTDMEPAELTYDADNEDEIMIILDDPVTQDNDTNTLIREDADDPENKISQKSSIIGTGFSHLDEFERKLELMAKELETEQETGTIGTTVATTATEKSPEISFKYIRDEITGNQIKKMNACEGQHVDVPDEAINRVRTEAAAAPPPRPPPRTRSRSRSRTPSSFLSAMTGGLVESQRLGSLASLVRGRSRSRSRVSRHSSSDRSEVSLPELADAVVGKLMTISGRKRRVEQVDFDELFARGLAMSGDQEEEADTVPMIKFQEETGIGVGDPAEASGDQEAERGRRRQKSKKARVSDADKELELEKARARTRSREYAKPQDIILSPIVKRDLFTGKLLDGITEEEVFLKKVTKFIEKNQQSLENLSSSNTLKPGQLSLQLKKSPSRTEEHSEELKTSLAPGKNFLDSKSGEELFSKSIEEGEIIEHNPQPTAKVLQVREENYGEPADKNMPKILKPDSLLKNEKFYEDLRSGLQSYAQDKSPQPQPVQAPEEGARYSQHLGRAEYGSLRRKPQHQSRDSSGDKLKPQVQRDESSERVQEDGRQARSLSRTSDYSTALPDLEVDPAVVMNIERVDTVDTVDTTERVDPVDPVDTQVLRTLSMAEVTEAVLQTHSVAEKRRELEQREAEARRQQLSDTKAWIHNGLMAVVGVGVLTYLQTLESAM